MPLPSDQPSSKETDSVEEQTPTPKNETSNEFAEKSTAPVASTASPPAEPRTSVDREAEQMIIDSLRVQVQDLFSQVTQLNGKLVKSYDRVSDLEDDLHAASQNIRSSALKIAELEMERTQHLAALNTGLLVEKSQVTAELTRVMERATDEAARRGRAENARAEIEKDLDDLSAGLFNQANTMVAQARYAQASSERKVEEAQQALKSAEEAVALMQQQMQNMQEEKEKAIVRVEQMQIRMGKGKWIEREASAPSATADVRLLSSHNPYQEFLLFVAHLRSMRPTTVQPPAMSTLLPLPFLTRLQTEDSDPTVRLDLAPSLNWLSRRSVLAAIHGGELTVEPMPSVTLIQELTNSHSGTSITSSMIPGNIPNTHNICCALCGVAIFPSQPSTPTSPRPPLHPAISRSASGGGGWSSSLFKNPLSATGSPALPNISPSSGTQAQAHLYQQRPHPTQVYIFRITVAQPSATNASSQGVAQSTPSRTIYPLCPSGWCLTRIRTTCSLWAFVRTIIVDRIWEEEPMTLHTPAPKHMSSHESLRSLITLGSGNTEKSSATSPTKPTVAARSKSAIGGLWGAISAGVEKVSARASGDTTPQMKEKSLPPVTSPDPPRATTAPEQSPTTTAPVHRILAPPPLPSRNGNRAGSKPTSTLVGEEDAATTAAPATTNSVDTPPSPKADEKTDETAVPASQEASSEVPTNPSTAPLPDSATASPVPPVTEPKSPTTGEAHVHVPVAPPSRTASPAPISPIVPPSRTASPAPTSPGAPPPPPPRAAARTASPAPGATGAPPPLPRRAAGRASRPVSLIAQAATNAAAGVVGTHTAPIPEATSGEDGKVATSMEPAEAKEAEEKPSDDPVDDKVAKPRTPEEPASVDGENPADVSVSAKTTPPEEDAVTAPVNLENETAPTSAVEEAKAQEDTENTVVPTTTTPEPVAEEKPVLPTIQTDTPLASLEKEEKDAVNTDDTEVYVGEGTWEERTWKELTRLREDMFWARVGGVR